MLTSSHQVRFTLFNPLSIYANSFPAIHRKTSRIIEAASSHLIHCGRRGGARTDDFTTAARAPASDPATALSDEVAFAGAGAADPVIVMPTCSTPLASPAEADEPISNNRMNAERHMATLLTRAAVLIRDDAVAKWDVSAATRVEEQRSDP